MTDIFLDDEPAHERFGFGRLQVGERMEIPLTNTTARAIQGHISGHAQYHGKRFKTRKIGTILHVMRVK